VVDVYGGTVAVQVLSVGMEKLQPLWLAALEELLSPDAIIARNDTSFRDYEHLPQSVEVLAGEPGAVVHVEENGVQYAINPLGGQKTGLFLDQKDNRQRLAGWADGARVLDAFCYAGGWSLSAAKAGAASVIGIDSSEEAITTATRNAELNGVTDRCRFIRGDVFEEFRRLVEARESFDIVIVDPPAFAKRKAQASAAARGYRDINTHAIKLVRPGGLLVTCSCSHHIGTEDFRSIITQAGRSAGRSLRLVEARGAALDHPVLLAMRETEYLKCLFLLVV
jgi:23S rRNA (cytosine1962-C5)-methyltransferase